MALTAICKLITEEFVPAVREYVVKCLSHQRYDRPLLSYRDAVRKKAVMAFHRFYMIAPETVPDAQDHLRKALCDVSPSVMAAAVVFLHDMAKVRTFRASPTILDFSDAFHNTA